MTVGTVLDVLGAKDENATGQKLNKTVVYSDSIKIVDYLDGFQYAGNILQFFPHAEGYVKVTPTYSRPGDMGYAYNYVYNYTDHLGNIRVSYSKDPQTHQLKILEENHTATLASFDLEILNFQSLTRPFGLKHSVYTGGRLRDFEVDSSNPEGEHVFLNKVTKTEYMYKYQGQERQDELGLNWDSFKWRNYDYAIGRFMNIDPLTEEYVDWGPYVFSGNRVIDARELEGLEPKLLTDIWDSAKNLVNSIDVTAVSFSLGAGFKISNTGATASVADFEYNIQDNTFSFSAINGFVGVGNSEKAASLEVDVAYSSKNFDNEKSEGGFVRGKGTFIKEGEKKEGSVAVFAKNKEDQKGAVLIETSTEKKDDKISNYATPETDTSYKFKLGFGIEFTVDWDRFNLLQTQN